MKPKLLVTLSLMLVAPPAFAQGQAATEPGSAAVAAPAPDAAATVKEKKVCRKQVSTGRRISHSTCLTPTQWKEVDEANARNAKDVLDNTMRQASIARPAGNPLTGQ